MEQRNNDLLQHLHQLPALMAVAFTVCHIILTLSHYTLRRLCKGKNNCPRLSKNNLSAPNFLPNGT